ncbi:hypothetical protein RSAG8_12552, partial [Rhizoctonia solani AG-8 WAC10335]
MEDPDATFGNDNLEFQGEERAVRRKVNWEHEEMSDRDSLSGEEIEIPLFDTDEDDSTDDGTHVPTKPMKPKRGAEEDRFDTGTQGMSSLGITPDYQKQSRISPWWYPQAGDEAHHLAISNSDDDPDQTLGQILTDVSPVKLKAPGYPVKPRPRMTMEVVIPTPRKLRVGRTAEMAGPSSASSAEDSPTGNASLISFDRTLHTGAQKTVGVTKSAASKAAPSAPILVADAQLTPGQVQQLVTAEFGADEGYDEFPPLNTRTQKEVDELCVELEAEIQDTADNYIRTSAAGEGQNEMLLDWKNNWGQLFLAEMYGHNGIPELRPCLCEHPVGARYRGSLTHHISLWDGHTWTRTSLNVMKQVIEAGKHLGPCNRTSAQSLLLGDVMGFHEVSVTYCGCDRRPDECVQLLRTAIMPCSTKHPGSGFTFRALRLYDLLAYDAKLSCSHYHAVLQRQSNNVSPQLHQSRLRELLRVSREWSFLQSLKRSGQVSFSPQGLGTLTLRCPACPCLKLNHILSDVAIGEEYLYAQLLSYDGSFQLVRKNKAIDQFDTSLTDCLMYFVEQQQYQAHLITNKDTAYSQGTKGNNDACYAQYSLNNMFGIGRLDAEGCERAWANLNGASGSTLEKGPGAQTDSLNYCMNDWNWRKMVSMVTFLLKKWKEAVRLSAEMEEAWDVVHDSIPVALSAEWETLSTEPRLVNRKWTSVFLMDDSAAPSRMRAVLDLNTIESERIIRSGSSEPGFTAPTWLSEGFDIERLQSRLRQDVHSYGTITSSRQSLDVYNRRSALSTRIQLHRERSALFIDVKIAEAGSLQSLAEETDGKPEHAGLYLPSQLTTQLSSTKRSERVIAMEKTLRKAECLETLRRLRTACSQKSQMITGKQKNARGEVANTRAQTAITRLTSRITQAIADYNRSFQALLALGVDEHQARPLEHLAEKHLDGLMSMLKGTRDLGEKERRMPWFWSVRDSQGGEGGISEDEEYTEGRCFPGPGLLETYWPSISTISDSRGVVPWAGEIPEMARGGTVAAQRDGINLVLLSLAIPRVGEACSVGLRGTHSGVQRVLFATE